MAERLRQAGVDVRIHDDHFAEDARDDEWLPFAGQHGWLVVTKDKRIRQRETERKALLDGGVGAFVITKGDMTGPEMGEALVKALPSMERLFGRQARPFIATVSQSGRVKLLPS